MAAEKTAKKTGAGSSSKAKPPRAKRAAASAKPAVKKVWAVVNHQSRLQSSQQRIDVLQTSSPYIQMPVRPRSNTPDLILFAQQLDSLLAEAKTQACWMRFWLIAAWAYDAPIRYKGHLLGITRKPATVKEIAAAMRCTSAEARKTLGVLERCGLVERIDCPEFDAIEPPPSRRTGWRGDGLEEIETWLDLFEALADRWSVEIPPRPAADLLQAAADTADWAVDLAGRCTEHVRTVEDQLADAGRRAAVMAKMIDRQRDRADRLFDTCGELRAKIRSAFDCGLNRN